MSSSKAPKLRHGPPDDLVTPVVSLKDLGRMIAKAHKLQPGYYEVVVEYKFGPGRLAEEGGAIGAMAITFGGLGLRPAEKESPMTIEVKAPTPERKKAGGPVGRKAVSKRAG